MATINLNLDNSLIVSKFHDESDGSDHYRLTVNISPDENNTVTIEDDGLYAPGDPATVSSKLDIPQIHGGVRVGYRSQWDLNQDGKNASRVSCNGIVHRTWTSTDTSGSNLTGKNPLDTFRGITGAPTDEQNIDVILPGDFIRVSNGDGTWNYYVITSVDTNDRIASVALIKENGGDF